jgi:hypothetical protein
LRTATTSDAGRFSRELHDDAELSIQTNPVAFWREKDHSRMSGGCDVLSEVLTERLGHLPPEEGGPEDRIDQDVDPRVQDLWIQGDTGALTTRRTSG